MSGCTKCNSTRVMRMSAKCNDMFVARINGHEYDGYVIDGVDPIGGGDYLQFNVCLECGQVQGDWPVPELPLERGMKIDYRSGEEVPIGGNDGY